MKSFLCIYRLDKLKLRILQNTDVVGDIELTISSNVLTFQEEDERNSSNLLNIVDEYFIPQLKTKPDWTWIVFYKLFVLRDHFSATLLKDYGLVKAKIAYC